MLFPLCQTYKPIIWNYISKRRTNLEGARLSFGQKKFQWIWIEFKNSVYESVIITGRFSIRIEVLFTKGPGIQLQTPPTQFSQGKPMLD